MFKFGFGTEDSESSKLNPANANQSISSAFEVKPNEGTTFQSDQMYDHLSLCDDEITLRKVTASVPSHLSPTGADIVPSTYEGGFKLWECALDLCTYIHKNLQSQLKEKSILELGAGHALPAIIAAKYSPAAVHIHDYNREVLTQVSMANVSANQINDVQVRYFGGAWSTLPSVVSNSYDVILSAETIYATQQSRELASCVIALLAPNGVAYIAGKTYYFGVGGGTISFRKDALEFAKEKHINIEIDVVQEFRDGVSNVREILRISRK